MIPACASSSPPFLMMYSTYKLNKKGDNIQPWHTPFPIQNQSVVPCPVLTVASWPAYRFLKRKLVLNIHWKDWCWSWSSNTLATRYKNWTHWKRPWCWELLKAGGEGDDRGQNGWMISPTQWTWVWINSGSWWWTGREAWCAAVHGVTKSWTRLSNWTVLNMYCRYCIKVSYIIITNIIESI